MPTIHRFETLVDAPASALFDTMTDVHRWTEWDPGWDRIDWDRSPVKAGSRFALKPKGAPHVKMSVVAAERPSRFVDAAHLWGAIMTTTHLYTDIGGGQTQVAITIETTGPLAFFWDRVLARKIAAGTADEVTRFVARALA